MEFGMTVGCLKKEAANEGDDSVGGKDDNHTDDGVLNNVFAVFSFLFVFLSICN